MIFITIESLKDYMSSEGTYFYLTTKIYEFLHCTLKDYSGYKSWYFDKQLPGIKNGERNILFVRNPEDYEEIIAVSCLKKDKEEQKICTIYVSDKYRKKGIGTSMLEASMKWLGTTKPLITIADYKLEMFASIIQKYDWRLTQIIDGLYQDNTKELCFNEAFTNNSK